MSACRLFITNVQFHDKIDVTHSRLLVQSLSLHIVQGYQVSRERTSPGHDHSPTIEVEDHVAGTQKNAYFNPSKNSDQPLLARSR